MDTSVPLKEELLRTDAYPLQGQLAEGGSTVPCEVGEPRYELGLWLHAVCSYFDSRNHPFPDAEQSAILTRDWANELIIARHALLRVSQLALRMVHLEDTSGPSFGNDGNGRDSDSFPIEEGGRRGQVRQPLVDLAEAIGDVCVVCASLLEAPRVGFYAWATIGKLLTRETGSHRDRTNNYAGLVSLF